MSLPLDGGTQPTPKPESPVARPVVGAVLPLTAGPAPASEELLGSSATRPVPSDPIATRVLVKGEPVSPLKGRADDFIWQKGRGADLPAANMTAEPGTITPQEITTAEQVEQKAKTEAQAANQQQKKPQQPKPAPTQAQPAQRPFFSPFSFFR